MSLQNQHLHRLAAFSMAVFGLFVFFRGVNLGEYRVLEDGSLMDTVDRSLVSFKNSKTVFTLRAGFDIYRSICYGITSFFLMLDLLFNSGYLTLPALVLAGGEIVSDFSDFCLAIVLIALNIGVYQAVAYGLTYLTLLMVEVAIWLGTCKFHEYCRKYKIESKMLTKKQEDFNEEKMKVIGLSQTAWTILLNNRAQEQDETKTVCPRTPPKTTLNAPCETASRIKETN